MERKCLRMVCAAAAAFALCLAVSFAGEFKPTKPFRFVVPFEAGGNSDVPARVVVKAMNKYSATEIRIANLTGAAGRTGAKEVMRARPDGYTFVQQPAGFPMQYALGIADFTYQDFAPIGYWVDSKLAVVVQGSSPYKTLDDLIKTAKEKPDTVRMGINTGTLPLFAVLKLEKDNGVSFNKVDLVGESKAPELLGGRVESYIDGFGALKPFIDSGDFRCLAVISDKKVAGYDAIPTLKELGYTNFDYLKQTFGAWAPKGTPPEAIAYINDLFRQAASDPDCIKELANLSYEPIYVTTEEYTKIMENVYAEFQKAAEGLVKRK